MRVGHPRSVPARWLVAAALISTPACTHRDAAPAATPETPAATPAATGWTRAEWLAAVDGYVGDPATLPHLGEPAFARLVDPSPWTDLSWTEFGDNLEEITRFFPAIKQLAAVARAHATVDEVVELTLLEFDVERAMVVAGAEFVAHQPDDDRRATRLDGIDQMRLGAAMVVCGLLYEAIDAGDAHRATVVTRLTDPASYAGLSRVHLQLVVATLDDYLLPMVRPALRPTYQTIRDAVAAAYAGRTEPPSPTQLTYQGIAPAAPDPSHPTTIVSIGGGYAVDVDRSALAWRVDVTGAAGQPLAQHWVEARDGEVRFEAACFDGMTEAALVTQSQGLPGATLVPSSVPGTWITFASADNAGAVRILSIAGRGCVAIVEGPPAQLDAARGDAFLTSLRANP